MRVCLQREAPDKVQKRDKSFIFHLYKQWEGKDISKEKELVSRPTELLSSFPCCLLQSSCLFNVVTVY